MLVCSYFSWLGLHHPERRPHPSCTRNSASLFLPLLWVAHLPKHHNRSRLSSSNNRTNRYNNSNNNQCRMVIPRMVACHLPIWDTLLQTHNQCMNPKWSTPTHLPQQKVVSHLQQFLFLNNELINNDYYCIKEGLSHV